MEAGTFQPHTPLFQDAQVTPSRACFVPSILAAHPEPSPRSGTGTNKRKAAWVRGYSYHRFWIILLFADAIISKLQRMNWGKKAHLKVWLKVILITVMDSVSEVGRGDATGRETFIIYLLLTPKPIENQYCYTGNPRSNTAALSR